MADIRVNLIGDDGGVPRMLLQVGDRAEFAAKASRTLTDALQKQRREEGLTAAESAALASALRATGDAEAKVAAKSIAADAAIRRLDSAMNDTGRHQATLQSALRKTGDILSNLGKGGGLFALGAGGLALASPFAAAATAVGAFGALAVPVLTKVALAQHQLTAAQQAYTQATTKPQRLTALKDEKKATDGLTASERALMGPLSQLEKLFGQMEAQIAPVVGSFLRFGVTLLKNVKLPLEDLVQAGGQALRALLAPLAKFLASPLFGELAAGLSSLAYQAAKVAGPALTQLLKVFLRLFVEAGPAGITLLKALLPAIVELTKDLTPAIVLVANLVAAFVKFLAQKHLLIPFLGVLAAAFLALASSTGIGAVVIAITVLVGAGVYLVKHWSQVWSGIKSISEDAWKFIHDGWGKYLFTGLYLLVNAVIFLRNHWNTAWHDIRAITATIVDRILGYFGLIVHAGATMLGWVPGIGPKLKQAAAAFDRFRNDVNSAIRGVQSRTVDVGVNFSLGVPGHRTAAAGGYITGPGTSTSDSIPALLSNGEYVVKAASVAKYGTHMMDVINAGRFAGGGQVGVHPSLPSPGQIQANIGPTLHSLAVQFAKTAITAIGPPAGHGGYGGGVSRWAPLVLQVLRMLGQPAGDLGTVLSQMQTESGGNPFAINLWDSNAAAGDPSRGLMQVIGSTFAAYAGPFRGRGIYDPLANIYAGLNYAIHRYGSGWTSVLGHGHGYDNGGWLPAGVSLAYNGTGRPERVLSPRQSAAAPVIINLHVQVGHGTHPVAAAQEIVKLLNQGAHLGGVKLRSSILGPG